MDAAARLGLERVSTEIGSSAWPSLRFDVRPDDGSLPQATRIGGQPRLPAGAEWPIWRDQPLIFMAQIALADLEGTAVGGELASAGTLSFWYAGSESAWGFDPSEAGASRVVYFPADADLEERSIPDGMPHDRPLAACAWSPRHELTIPPWESSTVESWNLSKAERESYFALEHWLGVGQDLAVHRLLGHADPIQGDMQLECQLVTNGLYCGDGTGYADPRRRSLGPGARDWRLLLQIDTDETLGSEWGDTGRVYFWIRAQDLAARRFDGTWHVMQCS